MQFMLPPFLPFQMLACTKKVHFTFGRFFPFEYVRTILQCSSQFVWTEHSSIEDLFDFYKIKFGIDYAVIHANSYQRYLQSNAALANWSPAGFEGIVVDSQFHRFREGDQVEEQVPKKQFIEVSFLNFGNRERQSMLMPLLLLTR